MNAAWRPPARPMGWMAVIGWTIACTAVCAGIAIAFVAMTFQDLGEIAMRRAVVSAIVIPMMLAVPPFLYLAVSVRKLSQDVHALGIAASTDGLTTCLNRNAFQARVAEILTLDAPARHGALLMIDADRFKSINDAFGHDKGDEALRMISDSIRSVLRRHDIVGRMGGEEFAIFLPGASPRTAKLVAERVRRAVGDLVFMVDGILHPLSVSIGGATFQKAIPFAELFRMADQRLYEAKSRGRNTVRFIHLSPTQTALVA